MEYFDLLCFFLQGFYYFPEVISIVMRVTLVPFSGSEVARVDSNCLIVFDMTMAA